MASGVLSTGQQIGGSVGVAVALVGVVFYGVLGDAARHDVTAYGHALVADRAPGLPVVLLLLLLLLRLLLLLLLGRVLLRLVLLLLLGRVLLRLVLLLLLGRVLLGRVLLLLGFLPALGVVGCLLLGFLLALGVVGCRLLPGSFFLLPPLPATGGLFVLLPPAACGCVVVVAERAGHSSSLRKYVNDHGQPLALTVALLAELGRGKERQGRHRRVGSPPMLTRRAATRPARGVPAPS